MLKNPFRKWRVGCGGKTGDVWHILTMELVGQDIYQVSIDQVGLQQKTATQYLHEKYRMSPKAGHVKPS